MGGMTDAERRTVQAVCRGLAMVLVAVVAYFAGHHNGKREARSGAETWAEIARDVERQMRKAEQRAAYEILRDLGLLVPQKRPRRRPTLEDLENAVDDQKDDPTEE